MRKYGTRVIISDSSLFDNSATSMNCATGKPSDAISPTYTPYVEKVAMLCLYASLLAYRMYVYIA